jgi:hypothetical protein
MAADPESRSSWYRDFRSRATCAQRNRDTRFSRRDLNRPFTWDRCQESDGSRRSENRSSQGHESQDIISPKPRESIRAVRLRGQVEKGRVPSVF